MADLKPRQQQIVDVAIKLIAEGGIQQLTMNNIARQIGISEPAIYRHFTNKKEILLTILAQFKRHSEFHANHARFFGTSGIVLLEAIFFEYINQCIKSPELASVVFAEEAFKGEADVLEEMLSIMTLVHDTITKVVERAQERGELRHDIPGRHMAFTFLGSLRLLVKHWAMSGHAFELREEGMSLWNSWKTLLAPQNDVSRG